MIAGSIDVTVTILVTDYGVEDILRMGFDGISEWGHLDMSREDLIGEDVAANAAKVLLNKGAITIVDNEDMSDSWPLTLEKLISGVKWFIEEEDNGAAYLNDGKLMTDCLDDFAADQIIQYALFEEILY